MKGLYGKAHFQTVLREREGARVTGRMARIRVIACGVCGTDLHFLRENKEYTPLGHEISAEVVEVGPEVGRVRPGQWVVCEDVTMCGACAACKSGQVRLCSAPYTLEGQPGMSDELVVHENMLNPYEGIDPVAASMVEPLAVALRGVMKLNLRPFASVAIFGMGTIGLFSAACARTFGAGRIVLFGHRPGSLRANAAEAVAAAYGADEIYYTGREGDIERALSKGVFDAAIVAAPPRVCEDAMRVVGYGGTVLAQGVTFGDGAVASLDVNDMVFHKKQLLTSIAEPAIHFPLSIEMIRSGRIDAKRVITHTLPLDGAETLGALYGRDASAVKSVVCMR